MDKDKSSGSNLIREAEVAYRVAQDRGSGTIKQQGEWTVEDYMSFPDDIRVELIDGVIYDMTAPTKAHQTIAGEVYWQLVNCRREHDMECFPMIAPVDVQLDKNYKTIVQPDVLIVCPDPNIEDMDGRVCGPPAFILEVLSDSTRRKDTVIKLRKYKDAGCREYWIVDPKNKRVSVFDFEKADLPKEYGFDAVIPVGISDGLCEVDFSGIEDLLEDGRKAFGPMWTE